jgi:LTXXQ motif family protein
MTQRTRPLVLAAIFAAAIPMAAGAQQHNQHGGAAGRAATPAAAPHAAPAPHVAPPARAAAAPHMAAPHFATPRAAPASSHFAPQRAATPRFSAPQNRHTAAPQNRPAAISRNVQQNRPAAISRSAQQNQLRQQRLQSRASVHSSPQIGAAQQLNTRQQLRAERALRQREDRDLRRLPASQRAQRRDEIRNARQQRALSRQQATQPNALRSNAQALRAYRRNGAAHVTADAARQGRFASRFAQQTGGVIGRDRFAHVAAHNAWRRGLRAAFVPWYGPVFWPYAYSDIFDYAFWPYGYDDGFWAYAYDDFFDGLFWGEAGPPAEYTYAAPYPQARRYAAPSYASVQELCKEPSNGVTAWPFAEIERKVGVNADQKQLLGDVRKASQEAAATFKASCPTENAFPLTPPGRLDAMTARLEATLQAVQTVRPPLEAFYNSLSDEQKERFNQLGPKNTATNAPASATSQAADSCGQPKPGLANLPIEKIEDAVNPTDAQEAKLNGLQDATNKAVSIMQAACPNETPITPTGRLEAMENRLQAMIDAAQTVKPALNNFYASLTNEQKARFDRIGRSLAETTGQSSD